MAGRSIDTSNEAAGKTNQRTNAPRTLGRSFIHKVPMTRTPSRVLPRSIALQERPAATAVLLVPRSNCQRVGSSLAKMRWARQQSSKRQHAAGLGARRLQFRTEAKRKLPLRRTSRQISRTLACQQRRRSSMPNSWHSVTISQSNRQPIAAGPGAPLESC